MTGKTGSPSPVLEAPGPCVFGLFFVGEIWKISGFLQKSIDFYGNLWGNLWENFTILGSIEMTADGDDLYISVL